VVPREIRKTQEKEKRVETRAVAREDAVLVVAMEDLEKKAVALVDQLQADSEIKAKAATLEAREEVTTEKVSMTAHAGELVAAAGEATLEEEDTERKAKADLVVAREAMTMPKEE